MLLSTRTRLLIGTIALLGAALMAEDVSAQTNTLTVSANVTPTCSVGAGTLDFGAYDPAANVTGQGSFEVECTASTDLTISLDGGTLSGGSSRQLTNGSETIPYNLFSDSARSTPWGDGNGLGDSHTVPVAGGSPQTVDVYGTLVASGSRPAGDYTDTVVITIAPAS